MKRERMKRIAGALVLAAMSQSALAKAPPFIGKPDCLVRNMEPEADGVKVAWDGGCKDGYADGEGKLEFVLDGKTLTRYTGEIHGGLPNGPGYMARHDGTIYEGWFKEGRLEGKGVSSGWYKKYEGEFRAGLPDGYGKAIFTLGGSYEGQWKAGKMHGKGTAVYPSGRVFSGEFADDVVAGNPPRATDGPRYRLTTDKAPAGHSIGVPRTIAEKAPVPLHKRWDQLTPEQEARVRAMYPLLDKDDEPPYYKEGGAELFRYFVDEIQKIGARGDLTIVLDIDSTGNPTGGAVFQTPDRAVARAALKALMQEKFKPALCAGTPCAMKFPFQFKFIAD